MRVVGSIVALPPVFVLRLPGVIAVASELHLLTAVAGSRLHLDERAVIELFTIGYPLWHRTLFREIQVLPGGHELYINEDGGVRTMATWQPPNPVSASPAVRCEMQAHAFRRAVHQLHLADSVFSLTAGLDTRAILTVLAEARTRISTCTLTGGRAPCLDARRAGVLSEHYGLPHTVVPLGGEFLRELPAYTQAAARLSGGLASLDQAHEVYFHQHLQQLGSRRLCGNLGNQLGRQGVETVSLRNGT